jgi:hypothetical protein
LFLRLQFQLPGGSDDHLLRAQAEHRLPYDQIKELAPVIVGVEITAIIERTSRELGLLRAGSDQGT